MFDGKMRRGSKQATSHVAVVRQGCRNCEACVKACPRGVYSPGGFLHRHPRIADPGACTGCGRCVAACPEGVLALRKAA